MLFRSRLPWVLKFIFKRGREQGRNEMVSFRWHFLSFWPLKKKKAGGRCKQQVHLNKRCLYIISYSWCVEILFPLGRTALVPRKLALELRSGILPPVHPAQGLRKSIHSLSAHDIVAFLPADVMTTTKKISFTGIQSS